MHEFITRGGPSSAMHRSLLAEAAADLTARPGETLCVPPDQDPGPWLDIAGGEDDPLPFAGAAEAVQPDFGVGRIGPRRNRNGGPGAPQ